MDRQPISHDCEGRPIYDGDQAVVVDVPTEYFQPLKNTLVTCRYLFSCAGQVMILSEIVDAIAVQKGAFGIMCEGSSLRKLPPDHLTPCTSDTYSVLTDIMLSELK